MSESHTHGLPERTDLSPAFRWAVALNAGYVVIELIAGLATGSLALLADAAHNLTDVAGLLIAWGATVLAARPPTSHFTYGLGRATILAALANAVAILIGVGAVVTEAVQRFQEPVAVPGATILGVALVGIAINAGTALLFRTSRHSDLNAEGAFLHMAADAAVSVAVVMAAAGILLTGWTWLDPAVAILVSLLIAWTSFGLLRSSLGLSFDGVPSAIDRTEVLAWLASRPGVASVHDLHIWSLSTTRAALTAHLIMPGGHPGDGFLDQVAGELAHEFSIAHVTLQIEVGDKDQCRLAPDDVV
ncbi:cation diffusion facilitator family transporter [Ancylobacter sp. TS-1]|uniref:cation diffusion facilitator family transporter n=1 Tax=Ancylobacter sp. TS-1 TaxID=1850374 RepID=UPI001265B86D|nr:cation diffusion facilitator family transporter [Ancylobacter sp. TS-1]QFR34669.1 cation diffusion facilitator family transporter [Ancylobacter sp. TS-1]